MLILGEATKLWFPAQLDLTLDNRQSPTKENKHPQSNELCAYRRIVLCCFHSHLPKSEIDVGWVGGHSEGEYNC